MVTFHNGNILDSGADIICHQVNCQGKMNSGVAKAIREKWPQVYDEYIQKYKDRENEILLSCSSFEHIPSTSETLLGDIQVVFITDKKTMAVVNMFAQEDYGYDGRRYTSYDAFWTCLGEIRAQVPKGKTIAFPRYIGCARGGANWNVIYTMICEVLDEDYNIEFWDYDGG